MVSNAYYNITISSVLLGLLLSVSALAFMTADELYVAGAGACMHCYGTLALDDIVGS